MGVPRLLRVNRPFRDFWTGQTISLFGDQIALLAIPLLAVITLHADAQQMGLLAAVELAPSLGFGVPLGGRAAPPPRPPGPAGRRRRRARGAALRGPGGGARGRADDAAPLRRRLPHR